MTEAFDQEISASTNSESRREQQNGRALSFSPKGFQVLQSVPATLPRPPKFHDRPAGADIAFCVAAHAEGMLEGEIVQALASDYLSRDSSPAKRSIYPKDLTKMRDWGLR